MKINQAGLNLIKEFESLHDGDLSQIGLQPKLCPAGVWTEGWGRAMRGPDGKFLTSKNTIFKVACSHATIHNVLEADRALLEDTTEFSSKIAPMIKVDLNDNQFSACVSLAYNIGVKGFRTSKVLEYINKSDFKKASDSFMNWTKADGRVLPGLVRRRKAEQELFNRELE